VIPFAAQQRGQSLRAAVDDYHARAEGKASVDYAFHMIVSDPTPTVLKEELPALIDAGYTSFKIYMTYDDMKLDDGQILRLLAVARRHGALAMVHAENADCIAWLTEALESAGQIAPKYHATARPMAIEREATHRAITLSELVDVPILIVHVSGREAIEQIRWAHAHGLRIYAETCPQYLFLTADHLDDGYEGAKCVCSPPPRDKANQRVVWDGLADGLFTIFSSDHAPFRFDDPQGKKPGGQEVPFSYIPNGIPGLETRLPLLFSEGVRSGRITLNQFVALTATNPAKLYGLNPRKGTIAIGSDADIAIWDPDKQSRSRIDCSTMTSTTRPTKACASPAGRSRRWSAARGSGTAASFAARPASAASWLRQARHGASEGGRSCSTDGGYVAYRPDSLSRLAQQRDGSSQRHG
jgi:dihydropyrimidinase